LKVGSHCECDEAYVLEDICRVSFKLKADEDAIVLMTFSSPLDLTSHDIALLTDLSVSYKLKATDSATAYFVYLQFNPTPTSPVTLGLAITGAEKDHYDVPISQLTHTVEFSFSKASDSSSPKAAVTASQVTAGAVVAGAALAGMLIGNPQTVFGLLNQLQFASLIPLMHFSLSEELSSLLIGNNPFNSLPNFSSLWMKLDWFSEPYSKAKHYGFETAGFLFNIGQELTVLMSLLIVLVGLYVGSTLCCCIDFKLYCSKKLTALKKLVVAGYLQGCFQELLVSAMVQLRSQEYLPWPSAVSCCCSWAVIAFGIIGSVLLVLSSFKGSEHSKFRSFFAGLSSSVLVRLQVPGFYVHRLVCVVVITLSSDRFVQGSVCLGVSFLVILSQKFLLELLGMLRVKKLNWSFLIVETADWISLIVLLVYAAQPSLEDYLSMVNVFYAIIFTLLGATAVTTLFQLIVFCRKPQPNGLEL
jgi:hypothetical protein